MNRELLFQRIAVIGVGLIGGSLARACRGRLASRVIGLDRDRIHLNHAMALGLVDEVGDLPTGVAGADLVVVAVPVGAIAEVVRAAAPHLALRVYRDRRGKCERRSRRRGGERDPSWPSLRSCPPCRRD